VAEEALVTDVQDRIKALLERRRTRLPLVQKEVVLWKRLDQEIGVLDSAINELRAHPRTPAELSQLLYGFNTEELRKGIASAIETLRVLEARFARRTINIGVSGRARVGKSTLLQSMSGLADEQIPTGSGLPVTAVRSRIFHSTAHQRATLSLHTFASFSEEILRPYHDELGLPSPALSPREFESWNYPSSESELGMVYRERHTSVTILRRLKEMQSALSSYEGELNGGERTVDLGELRQYVAYPTNDQIANDKCPRRYLAVRDVRIDCTFPHLQVDHVGIIDLPGLGELSANAEEYHLAGLQNEVDLVLLVKRPVEGMAYWGREDGATTNLLDRARGFVKNRSDFVFIVINSGGTETNLATSLRDDIRRQVNDGDDGKHFQVLEGNASDQQSVFESILKPILTHLSKRLPVMDDEVFEGARANNETLKARVLTSIQDLRAALNAASGSLGSMAEDLERRTVELRRDLAGALSNLVDRLQANARSGEEDPQFIAAVETSYDEIQNWIETGFGVGEAVWCADALRQMRVDRNSGPFAAHELNRIRVEISGRFCALDNYFDGQVSELWIDAALLMKSHLGDLLGALNGHEALAALAQHFSGASEPCPTLSKAVRDLLELRLEYRTNLHPRVRKELDGLNLQVLDPETGEPHNQVVVEVSEAGAERFFRLISQLAQQAAYRTKKALVAESLTPALVLHAAAEQFEDVLIRSGESEREFRRFSRSFRDEVWPDVFNGIDSTNARFAKVARSIQAIREHLGAFERGVA
jgi:hypothetical protein